MSPFQTSEPDIDQVYSIFQSLQKRFEKFPYPSIDHRIQRLKKLKKNLIIYRDEINLSLFRDFAKPYFETESSELIICLREINVAIKNLKYWSQKRSVDTDILLLGSSSYTQAVPRGVVLIISPWNYPINLSMVPLISAIAAGNVVILKPSEFSERSSQIIKKIISDTFDEDEVHVVLGGSDIAQVLTSLPFNFIFFTGSSSTARSVLQNAAKNLTPVALELGGKTPVIIEPDYPLKKIVRQILFGKLLNAGQTCVAPDFVCIHSGKLSEFEELWHYELKVLYGDEPILNPDYCGIIDDQHFSRLRNVYNEAINQGAENGGKEIFDAEKRKIHPILLKNVQWNNPIMKMEIFGPILPLIEYNNLSELLQHLNTMDRPLSLYLYSSDSTFQKLVVQGTRSGGISINMCLLNYCELNLPFGGDQHSGWGRYHGHSGFLEFSHQKSIARQGILPSSIYLFFPPYRGIKQRLKNLLIKLLS